MIFCHDKIYAKVWKITQFEKYLDLQITTSEKDQDGNYINSGWFPRAIGHAFNSLKGNLKEGDRICITKSKFTNERYVASDGTKKSAFRFIILEASIEDSNKDKTEAPATTQSAAPAATPDTAAAEDDCPW